MEGCPASEISRRVYTRRGILDRWILSTEWMSKVAPHVYTRDVISDSEGASSHRRTGLTPESASHVYTRDALSGSGCNLPQPDVPSRGWPISEPGDR